MKKIFSFILVAISCALVAFSCTKEDGISDGKPAGEDVNPTQPAGEKMSITAELPVMRVSFDPEFDANHNPTEMSHAWESGDKLRVVDASNESNYRDFELVGGVGTATGVFSGEPIAAASYNVTVIPAASPSSLEATQTQIEDGSTSHLKFVASASGVTDLKNFTLNETSSIIGFIVKLPAGATETINQVDIVKSTDDFTTSSTLTINLGSAADANNDDILEVYANIPSGWAIAAGTKMFLRFKNTAPAAAHSVYTRYQEFASAATITPGKFNFIKMNCVNIDKYAGKDDNGTSAHPYLIADPYQVASINGLATGGQTTYFKMIDNVDMTGVTHIYINTNSGYTQAVNFDGNSKTISNLGTCLFYVFKGSIQNLTLSDSNVGTKRGIFAEYCQGEGHTITNVDIIGGSMATTSNNGGALIGRINNGSGTTVTITDCDVTNTTVSGAAQTGGLVGSAEAQIVVNNCTVSQSGSGTSSVTASGANSGGLIGQTTAVANITDCTVSGVNVTGTEVVGGVIGYVNSASTVSGCTYTGGTVKATAKWCGGAIGSIGEFAAEISDCHVENATVTSSSDRLGGFVGQVAKDGTVKGCSVGTNSQRVTVASTMGANTANSGGFAGVCYGTITKNGDVHNTAYVKITSNNTDASKYVNISGFAAYVEKATIEYSDADADLSGVKGQQVGGFSSEVTAAAGCKFDHCTANATVNSGANYAAGFIANAKAAAHTITNCSSSGSISGAATVAGFVGFAAQGTWTNNSTSCTVTASGGNSGGFAGQLNGSVTVSRCYTTGSVTGNGNVCGGFTGIASNGATINDCYSTSNLGGGTRKRGGIAGYVDAGTVSINRCYTTSNISNNFEMGGLVGFVNVETFTMTKCAAWNETLVASSRGASNWSSAACVGVTYLTCTLTDNYRNPNMDTLMYWGTNSQCSINLPTSFQHPDVSTSAPLTDSTGATVTHANNRPYQGKCDASKTLSQLASTTLGWSSDIWDFTGDLPTLK